MLKINRTVFVITFLFVHMAIPSALSPSRVLDGWVWHAQKQIPVYKIINSDLAASHGQGAFAAYRAHEGNPEGALAFYASSGEEIRYALPCVCEPFSMTCKQVLLTAGAAALVGASVTALYNRFGNTKINVKKSAGITAGAALAALLYYYKTSGPYIVLPVLR